MEIIKSRCIVTLQNVGIVSNLYITKIYDVLNLIFKKQENKRF